MSNNKRKWEIEYEKFVNGEMDTKIQELEAKDEVCSEEHCDVKVEHSNHHHHHHH